MRALEKCEPGPAATPLFRWLGGNQKVPAGDEVQISSLPGQHRVEWKLLAVMVPLVVGAAVFDVLWGIGGAWWAWLGVLPLAFVVLQIAALAVGGHSPAAQWWRWALALGLWSGWQLAVGSGVGWVAALWLLLLAAQGIAALRLGWRWLMENPSLCTVGFRVALGIALKLPAIGVAWKWGWEWAAGYLAVIGAVWACGTFLPNARVFGPMARRVEGQGVLITIDDGPDPEDTPVLLDLLDASGRKAVFFVIGEKVARHPDLAREIVRRGHELGNHTMTHPVAWFGSLGPGRTRREIEACQQVIETVTGVKPRWFRAPAGHRNWYTHPVLATLGLSPVGWSRRAYDTVRGDVPKIVHHLTVGAAPGDILLMHEGTPIAPQVMSSLLTELQRNESL